MENNNRIGECQSIRFFLNQSRIDDILLLILFFSVVMSTVILAILLDEFIFKIKNYNVITNICVFGSSVVIAFCVVKIFSQHFLCHDYTVCFKQDEIHFYKNADVIDVVPINKLSDVIILHIDKGALYSTKFTFQLNEKHVLSVFTGFFVSYKQESKALNQFIKEHLVPYLLEHNFSRQSNTEPNEWQVRYVNNSIKHKEK